MYSRSSRCLSPENIKNGIMLINGLKDYLAKLGNNPNFKIEDKERLISLLDQTLEESKCHFLHHLLGESFPAIDIDLMDYDKGHPIAITSFKIYPYSFTDTDKKLYGELSKISGLPLLQIRPYIRDERDPLSSIIEINGINTNIQGWRNSLIKSRNL